MYLLTENECRRVEKAHQSRNTLLQEALTTDRLYENIKEILQVILFYKDVFRTSRNNEEGYECGLAVDGFNGDGWPDLSIP